MEKLLVVSNFSFSHDVFKRIVLQTSKNHGLFGKGLRLMSKIDYKVDCYKEQIVFKEGGEVYSSSLVIARTVFYQNKVYPNCMCNIVNFTPVKACLSIRTCVCLCKYLYFCIAKILVFLYRDILFQVCFN